VNATLGRLEAALAAAGSLACAGEPDVCPCPHRPAPVDNWCGHVDNSRIVAGRSGYIATHIRFGHKSITPGQ
jgi:hypothetical protein